MKFDEAHERASAAIGELWRGLRRLRPGVFLRAPAAAGGSLPSLRGDLAPAIERVGSSDAGSLAPAPIRTRHGWHVLRLDRHAASRTLPFEAVEEHIRAALHARSAVAASARYVEALAADAEIEGLSLSGAAS